MEEEIKQLKMAWTRGHQLGLFQGFLVGIIAPMGMFIAYLIIN